MALLSCEHVTVRYENNTVLHDLSFEVNAGDYLCILGENGSGKTTLLKTLLGLISPDEGKISFEGGFSAQKIGYLPQQTQIQKDFPASVQEVVLSGCLNRMGRRLFTDAQDRETVRQSLEQMNISHLARRSYRELSGGQQQRVLLARALCAAGSMLVADEPVTGLDPASAKDMYSILEKLHKDGMTVIMITHDTEAAVQYATHILSFEKEFFFGTAEQYRNRRIGA